MAIRKDDDLMEDYCPKCSAYTGGDSVCPNCGAKIFDDTGLEEMDEDEDGRVPEVEKDEEEEDADEEEFDEETDDELEEEDELDRDVDDLDDEDE